MDKRRSCTVGSNCGDTRVGLSIFNIRLVCQFGKINEDSVIAKHKHVTFRSFGTGFCEKQIHAFH